jgi:hypothetical protein
MSIRPGRAKGPYVGLNGGGPPSPSDHKVLVDGSDVLAEFLQAKIIGTGGISAVTVDKGGGVLAVQISGGAIPGDHKVLNSGADTTPDYLSSKVVAGFGILTATLFPAGDEQLQVSVDINALEAALEDDLPDDMVAVTSGDQTTGYLGAKLLVGSNLTKVIGNPGLSEYLLLDLSSTPQISELYFAPPGVDGTWRIRQVGSDLVFERRESGVYNVKGSITP